MAGGYRCAGAQRRAQVLRSKARVQRKMVCGNAVWTRVIDALRTGLSPEQASGILLRMPDPVRISHESIYTALYAMPRGELRAQLLSLLPRGHKTRRRRSAGSDRRGFIPGATSIDERPIEVSERLLPGHWEGDLIKGAKNQSQIGTLVERKTLYTVLAGLSHQIFWFKMVRREWLPQPAFLRRPLMLEPLKWCFFAQLSKFRAAWRMVAMFCGA